MPGTVTIYSIKIACPGDAAMELIVARDVIAQWNARHALTEKRVLLPLGEDVAGASLPTGPRGICSPYRSDGAVFRTAALANQYAAEHGKPRVGFLNPALYALGKAQYTASATKTACYSNGQTSNTGVTTGLPAAQCIFNDVTTSNNDVPCEKGTKSCELSGPEP